MNYDFAKQLIEMGFPHAWGAQGEYESYKIGGDFIFPTLSELIEACGDRFGHLARQKAGDDKFYWTAYEYSKHGDFAYGFHFQTPEEAVAKLWLSLNKK
jgi:hypothetical protein